MSSAAPDLPVLNVAAYRFARLDDLRALRARLQALCREAGLRGTILLSPEGINLFVAGGDVPVQSLLHSLRQVPGLADLAAKYSRTAAQPFRRMLVRLKKEIIAFGVPQIDPARHTSPRIAPRELKRWIDEGRPFTLLDTRNDYEIRLGTFRGAVPAGVDHFREFPAAVARLPAALRSRPVVTFCTGGIRCEKAAPYLETQGFAEVYQLDGGILKYFEECGGEYFEGECFVFDQRVGLDASLHETATAQCFNCQSPLDADEQADPRHVPGESCPYCYRTPEQRLQQMLAGRQAALQELANPLPGRQPCDNFRPLGVPQRADGALLRDALAEVVRHLPPAYWDERCAAGEVLDEHGNPVAADRRVRAGERFVHRTALEIEPDVSAGVKLLHEDEAIIVIDKPAPLPVHPAGRFRRNTLQHLLESLYAPQKPRLVHRLDANTTGVMIAARTRHFAARLQPQFEAGEVHKTYLARVHGSPAVDRFDCDAPVSIGTTGAGMRSIDHVAGVAALTRFEVLERMADGTSVLLVTPLTGRTNQIRLHCAHLGMPICGDQAYMPGRAPANLTRGLSDPPLCLHAWQILLQHPASGAQVRYAAPAPAWAGGLVGTV